MGKIWRRAECGKLYHICTNFHSAIIIVSFLSACIVISTMPSFRKPFVELSCDHRWLHDAQKTYLYTTRRSKLYEDMSIDIAKNGPLFLDMGTTSQGLQLSELFNLSSGQVVPLQKPAHPPVRATVLHLDFDTARKILQAVQKTFPAAFIGVMWYQDPRLYHSSMYHASHHLEPIPASREEIAEEIRATNEVAKRCCPLDIRLERVVLTSTGVLLGCWQVVNGTDPAIIRKWLKTHLPNSPTKQLYNPVMIHTSLARILGPPRDQKMVNYFDTYVSNLNMELCNFKATLRELWFVEEMDVLALALNGRLKQHRFPLECNSTSGKALF
ncbi:hypothetical protein O6H91_03G090300 [Diphasiastrum complanatum]|uniref:Uncharacterized protein n=1 Tax=Diphasiastrum complanatum TaxID=34168 RepID=A0ACC2E999_DIPCM|nr:hypothetical protein O6H91_03G090300 [Diphasiastrum complanatum]